MRVALISGLAPSTKNSDYLGGTLFDEDARERCAQYMGDIASEPFSLDRLCFDWRDVRYPVLRPRWEALPHLTTFTLEAILQSAGVEYDLIPTAAMWSTDDVGSVGDAQAVLLSTTFLWNRRTLDRAVEWIDERFPGIPVVVGGQYSNLKYLQILDAYPSVDIVVRGDGEQALPQLLAALSSGDDLRTVPNLVFRDAGGIRETPLENVDIELHPSPGFPGRFPVVPYESMRGCPFGCKFCSFPMASPIWRYKSARKIHDDWAGYAEVNGARFITAKDSTFTVPPSRMRELLELLPPLGLQWEAYSRANTIKDEAYVEALVRSHCRTLSIGFESMSEHTLKYMDKRVTAAQNRRAFNLLKDSPIGYRCSFMAGYPGETPDDFALTHDFLTEEYSGYFMLSVFCMQDEQMPVWADAARFGITVDPDDPEYGWEHVGMDVATARELNHRTLDEVRRRNDDAVLVLWQSPYQHRFLPHLSVEQNRRIDKAIERIGMLPRDRPDRTGAQSELRRRMDELRRYGIYTADPASMSRAPLLET